MKIFVDTPSEHLTIETHPDETIHDIKAKILNKTGTPIDQQRVRCGCWQKMDDCRTLSDHNIQNNSTLKLLSPNPPYAIQINLRPINGITLNLEVESTDNLATLKTKLYSKHKIPPESVDFLLFEGKRMDEERSLEEQLIKDNSTLRLLYNYNTK